ncbi:WD40-repeat-containing domain protein [Diplogelasinospora grovesii]|uniref:WD40-repeat-containing domain protein n=1 Tax=Diplogelasinospora grovesii TaxID=303347 RepID=A0AAN6N3R2_9PEZI|nr:WD40-repeat-containing domain protein [Diplogelasinospora grovesii]
MASFKNKQAATNVTNTAVAGAVANDVALPSDIIKDTISSIRFSPASNHLAATSWDGRVYIYDVTATNISGGVMPIPSQGPMFDCDFSKDGTILAAAGADKSVYCLDLSSGQTLTLSAGYAHAAPVRCVRFLSANFSNMLATGSWDKTVKYWDLRQPTPVATLVVPERVYSMDTASGMLVAATADNQIHLVNLQQNPRAIHQTMPSLLSRQTRSVSIAHDASRWGYGSIEGRAAVQAVNDRDRAPLNMTWKCHRETPATVAANTTTTTTTRKGEPFKVWTVNSVNFHPTDREVMATAGSDGTFAFWGMTSKCRLKQFPNVGGSITAAAWNKDGTAYAYAIGYDWSKGYAHNTPNYPTRIMVHPVTNEETRRGK